MPLDDFLFIFELFSRGREQLFKFLASFASLASIPSFLT